LGWRLYKTDSSDTGSDWQDLASKIGFDEQTVINIQRFEYNQGRLQNITAGEMVLLHWEQLTEQNAVPKPASRDNLRQLLDEIDRFDLVSWLDQRTLHASPTTPLRQPISVESPPPTPPRTPITVKSPPATLPRQYTSSVAQSQRTPTVPPLPQTSAHHPCYLSSTSLYTLPCHAAPSIPFSISRQKLTIPPPILPRSRLT